MICAACNHPPQQSPCEYCGADPLVRGQTLVFRLEEQLSKEAPRSWRGLELSQNWPVQIKELPLGPSTSAKAIELAHREASVLQQLEHPGIPRYFDRAVLGTGKARRLLLVTELVTGNTLEAELERHRYTEDEVLDVLEELLGILRYLHGLAPPVVHRDVCPAHVIRRQPGNRLVLADFGSVRDAVMPLGGDTVAGTFGYMAPEQFAGDAGPASDLYALGAVAVRLLSRQQPHKLHDNTGNIRWESALKARPSTRLLLAGLLQREPDQRLDAQQARKLIKAARKERRADDGPTATAPPTPEPPRDRSKPRPKPKPRPKSREQPAEVAVVSAGEVPAKGGSTALWMGVAGVLAAGTLGLSILAAAAILLLL